MTGERALVGHDHATADLRVMSHMRAGHEEAVVPDTGYAAAAFGAGIHRDALADATARADHEPRVFAPILEILRHLADAREGVDLGLRADFRISGDHRVALDDCAGTDPDLASDHAERAHPHAVGQFRAGLDDGGGVNLDARIVHGVRLAGPSWR